MSKHFSNNRKINGLTVEGGDAAWERGGKIKGMSPHSDCSQSIYPCIYTEWMDDASKAKQSPAEVSEMKKKESFSMTSYSGGQGGSLPSCGDTG